ncbi:PREDICTED: NDR1/HIN1-Like protein 3-like [Prunus mume]|uniref:NDR1/HIN1-Like protein 3-like n=1 Tax=Prunus mume TaxID=102107 RepID=A0ABM0PLP8_PRUMU|nr:PREDICTED: NDR1/HIN1-Like protein 3-like [Prunus mume]
MSGGCACCFCLLCNTFLCFTLAFFMFCYILTSDEPKFRVTDASLTQFNFNNTDNSTLHYNLALNITIRNSNKKVGIDYRRIQVIANYRKKTFAMMNLTSAPFYQGHKNTTTLHAVLEGQQLVVFGESDISQFNSDTTASIYSIDLQLALQVRARYFSSKTAEYPSSKIDCKLQVPLSDNETSPSGFNVTMCWNVHILTDHGD